MLTGGRWAATSAELPEHGILGREVDIPAVQALAEIPVIGLGETGGQRVRWPDAELRADLGGGVHGLTVVEEILAERGLELRWAMDQVQGLLEDVGDQLHEADLADHLLAGDVVGLAERPPVAKHGGHGIGQVFDVTKLAQPAAGARHEHGPTADEAIEEERLVVASIQWAVNVGGPGDADGQTVLPMPEPQHVLAGDLVLGVLAPVERAECRLVEGYGSRVIVDAT